MTGNMAGECNAYPIEQFHTTPRNKRHRRTGTVEANIADTIVECIAKTATGKYTHRTSPIEIIIGDYRQRQSAVALLIKVCRTDHRVFMDSRGQI